jgi:O-antigen/teichoic acid export membrane protein
MGAALSICGKGLGLLTQLAVVFLATAYMTKEEYGGFAIVVSVGMMAQLADVGLSQPLINLAASASSGILPFRELKKYSSTAFFGMAAVAILCIVASLGFIFHTNAPQAVIGIPKSVDVALAITVISYLITLPFLTAQKVQTGFQQYWEQYSWQFLGSVLAFTAVVFVTFYRLPTAYVVGALQIPVSLCIIGNWVHFHWTGRHPEGQKLRPQAQQVVPIHLRTLLQQGVTPVVAQVSSGLIYAAPVWCTGKLFGAVTAGSFFTIYRILSPVAIACTLVVTPLWPACAKASSVGDIPKLRNTLLASLGIALGLSVVGVPCMIGIGTAAGKLAGFDIRANSSITVVLAVWFLFMNFRQSMLVVALGVGRARLATIAFSFALIATFILPQARLLFRSSVELMRAFIGLELLLITALSFDLHRYFRRKAILDPLCVAVS